MSAKLALGTLLTLNLAAATVRADEPSLAEKAVPAMVTVGAGLGAGYTFTQMLDIYDRGSVPLFESGDGTRSLSRVEISRIGAATEIGDEVRVTILSSDAEERAIRIQQLEKRRNELRTQRMDVRNHMARMTRAGKNAAALADGREVVDFHKAISEIDHQIDELKTGEVPVEKRPVTRVFDLQKSKVADLENFLQNKVAAGRPVLKIERMSLTTRKAVSLLRKGTYAGIGVAVLGGVLMMQEVEGDELPSLAEGRLYAPPLKSLNDVQ